MKNKMPKNNKSNRQQWQKNVKIMAPVKYLSNLWRTLEMSIANCEINLDTKWSKNCVIVATNVAAQATTFLNN